MQAIFCDGAGQVRIAAPYPVPEPPPGWARVRVTYAGICATDLELIRGYKSFQGVLGHEFCGVVETSPAAPGWEGRRVVGEINIACGVCMPCRRGHRSHCAARRVLGILGHDGAFAGYLTLPLENLHAVPDGVPDTTAVFAEPLAAALEILEGVHVRPAMTVYILGAGKLGLLVAQVLRLTGCACTLLGRHPAKLALAAGWGLATVLLPAAGVDGPAAGPDIPPADLVVDCTGHPDGPRLAGSVLRPRGTLVLKSTFQGAAAWHPTDFVVNEWTLVGSRCGPFAPALRLLAQGLVDPRPLIEATYPLAQGLAALEHARRPGALKILLRIGAPDSG
ncbi:MAG TPA: alcohol dehydrogenase catalytic domain-containing protein [Chloroflexia bacterium]|nr:alcohol dehydrogenase catalytic domain-containing protein [Chloroflexia bacterium]